MPEIESLKRQIETIQSEIANHESVREAIEKFAAPEDKANLIEMCNRNQPSLADLREVLATLERLMPPF